MRQIVHQLAQEDVLNLKEETRVWYGPTEEIDHAGNLGVMEKRLKATIVVVGEIRINNRLVGPSFKGGNLSCSVSVILFVWSGRCDRSTFVLICFSTFSSCFSQ